MHQKGKTLMATIKSTWNWHSMIQATEKATIKTTKWHTKKWYVAIHLKEFGKAQRRWQGRLFWCCLLLPIRRISCHCQNLWNSIPEPTTPKQSILTHTLDELPKSYKPNHTASNIMDTGERPESETWPKTNPKPLTPVIGTNDLWSEHHFIK